MSIGTNQFKLVPEHTWGADGVIRLAELLGRAKWEGNCLIWTGARGGRGPNARHGHVCLNGRMVYVHRLVWEMVSGVAIPEGYCICHSCDNPPCIWPEHLWLGTPAQNMFDRDLKGRSPNGKLTEAAVSEILADLASGRKQIELARKHGVDPTLISQIKRRIIWAHVEAVA